MPNNCHIAALIQTVRSVGLTASVPLLALARGLADAAVLVPMALTDDGAVKSGRTPRACCPVDPAELALCVREGLEQIARGER